MKKFIHIFVIILLFINPYRLLSQEKKDFKVFNALLFKNTPDLRDYGFSPFNLIYEDGLITTNSKFKKGDFNWRYIDLNKVRTESKKSRRNQDIPTCLDVEYWGGRLYSNSTKKEAEDIFVNLINLYRVKDRTSLVSVFHYGALSERIYNASNVVYPAFYTHSTDKKEWMNMVQYWIDIIKRRNKKIPVYAFIWPQYNPIPEKHNLGYTFIDKKFWRLQLETLYSLCDGIVIWSHHIDEDGKEIVFDENMPWFKETLDFIKEHSIKN